MARREESIAEMHPHVIRQSADETGGEFVRFESTMYPVPVDVPATRAL